MTASLSGVFNVQQFTDAGLPAANYRLYSYSYGTTTQKTAYTDAAGTVAHTYTSDGAGGSYIALNARGELPAPLYLSSGSYDLALKTPAGATVWTRRADPTVNGADLASSTDATKGAALMGFNPALTYPTGTIGAALNADPIVANESSFPGITSTTAATATPAFQNFITACRGKIGFIPAGDYYLSAAIAIDPQYPTIIYGAGYNSDNASYGTRLHWSSNTNGFEVIYAYAQYAPGGGADAATGAGGTLGNSDNLVVLRGMALYGPGASLTPSTRTLQLYEAGTQTIGGGNGIFAYWANAMRLEDLWVSAWPGSGLNARWCFGSSVVGGYYTGNRQSGIALFDANNVFTLSGVRCIGNGLVSGSFASFNCLLSATSVSHPNLGVVIDKQCDFEGAGIYNVLAGYIFKQSAGNISSVTVASGVATVVLTGTVNFSTGDWLGISGGTTSAGNAALNSPKPAVITKAGNTITFATTAANGSYATTGLIIAPYAAGLGLQSCYGITVNPYTETCSGASVYVYASSRGVTITGGATGANKIYIESYYQASTATPVAAGTGYATSNTLTVSGGTLMPGGSPATLTVTGVSAGGVTTATVLSGGSYAVLPSNPVSVTGGAGSGATFTLGTVQTSPGTVSVIGNQFYGVGGGIYTDAPDSLFAIGNQYVPDGTGEPTIYNGGSVISEAGGIVIQGGIVGRGRNLYVGTNVAADNTNWGSGYNVLQNIQQDTLGLGHGQKNVVFGPNAGAALSTGYANVLMGWNAGVACATSFQNVAIGNRALDSATNTQNIIAIGQTAGTGVTSGGNEINIGTAAGQHDTASATNGNNVHIGVTAGRITNGSITGNTTIIGAQSVGFAPTSGMSNFTAIGYNTQADATYVPQSNRTVIGNSSTIDTVLYGVAVLVPKTVATLPAASTLLKGAKSFVTDASATMTAGIGAVVASGGANNVPVYCDGTNWRIG